MAERGTIRRCIAGYQTTRAFQSEEAPSDGQMELDKNLCEGEGSLAFLYRAIDSKGDTVESISAQNAVCPGPNASAARL